MSGIISSVGLASGLPIQDIIDQLIAQINNVGEQVNIFARVNDNGDGVVIIDSSGGDGTLTIQDSEGAVAGRLNLLREPTIDGLDQTIDGSFEFSVEVDADDTLNDVVEKINLARFGISATVISDGSSTNPFRLSITSGTTGTDGELMFDTGTTGLEMSDLVKAQDAVLFFGGADSDNPIVIRSSSNTLTNVVQDVTINLLATSDEEVGLTVARDVDAITETIQTFVTTHNSVIDSIDELTFFDAEALQSGPLRGEGTINTVRSRLRSVIIARLPTDDATVSRLSSIGISFGSGGKLEFDEARFREAFGEDPEAVEELFTLSDTKQELDSSGNPVINPNTGEPVEKFVGLGFSFRIDEVLDALTRTFDGLLASKDNSLRSQEDLLSDRAEFLLTLLDGKRARLELRFARLEQSLNALTSQQSALSILAVSAASFR